MPWLASVTSSVSSPVTCIAPWLAVATVLRTACAAVWPVRAARCFTVTRAACFALRLAAARAPGVNFPMRLRCAVCSGAALAVVLIAFSRVVIDAVASFNSST